VYWPKVALSDDCCIGQLFGTDSVSDNITIVQLCGYQGSVILTTESRTHCSIAPAYMNIHKPYLILSVSMDPGGVVQLPCM